MLAAKSRLDMDSSNGDDLQVRSALRKWHRAVVWIVAAAPITPVAAQAVAPRRTVWDGAYTQAQAERGAVAFDRSCGGCHVLAAEGRAPLVAAAFWKSFSQKTVADLLEFITRYMPNGSPHSLSDATYQDITAAILRANGFPAGGEELGPKTASEVRIIPGDGNSELPANALVRVIGCLTRNGAGWAVTSATSPERAESARTAEDALRPLGNRTIELKFVLTRLDSWSGSRILVNGLLIGANGSDGINVTDLKRVAQTCP